MEKELLNTIKQASKYWWSSLLIGILAIIMGIWSINTPDVTLVALTFIFITAFFISGTFDITFAIMNRKVYDGWGWTLAGGIIDILFGILLWALPLPVVTTMLIYFIGFWIMFRCIWTIGIAFELQRYVRSGWLMVIGILGLLFSFFYILSPVFNGVFVVMLASIAFITYGVFRIFYSFELKSINDKIKKINNIS